MSVAARAGAGAPVNTPEPVHLLVMGVAGSGKSTLANAIAAALACPMIEGDDHHPPGNRQKMTQGLALDDNDRMPWLQTLGEALECAPGGAVLTCSALKRRYRDRLRSVVPGLRIVHLHIGADAARARVAARSGHLFPASLVDSQFEALEAPQGEPLVLWVDAMQPLDAQLQQVLDSLGGDCDSIPTNTD